MKGEVLIPILKAQLSGESQQPTLGTETTWLQLACMGRAHWPVLRPLLGMWGKCKHIYSHKHTYVYTLMLITTYAYIPPQTPHSLIADPLTPYAYTTPIYNASPYGVTLDNPDGPEPPTFPGAYGKAALRSRRHVPSHLIGKTTEARTAHLYTPQRLRGLWNLSPS